MHRSILFFAALLIAAPAAAAPVEEVIAAERAFAADSQSESLKTTFTRFAAEDGIALRPFAILGAHEFIASWPDADSAGSLQWEPAFAGAALSGDLGFTTGPYETADGGHGTYLTVWQRQADGEWRWLIDHGAPGSRTPAAFDAPEVALLGPSANPANTEADGMLELMAADTHVDSSLAHGWAAIAEMLSDDARVMGMEADTAIGRTAAAGALAARPEPVAAHYEGGGVSAAGDLGWTYGYADWREGEETRRAAYLRIWQRQGDGWRIVVDNFAPFPPR
ncbi:nuclear transport factor 2 family protein [Parasphingopyxis marina]|uniref:Nuclear transport factor 2 family protein n=1 Tax=Parasphingopyxis marina TaxID=2761622 RepID=A0A842HVY2_9SPHN|nr:nuclear transport factor 2 family protein [Parasphingopyxis marina]MBC2776521.1 nuclear transport factor 2 family protein [Parasphingopyxis marina]